MSNQTQGLARERINAILDGNSFVEIGAAVKARSTDFNMQAKDTPSDGVVTGYGVIDGRLVYVYSQDAAVLGGTIGEMHAKKITKLYDLALKVGAPVIGLIDCAGIRLQESSDALNALGEIMAKQSMSSGVIPQITAIYGNCGGGLSLFPVLTDFTFMESKNAKLFLNSPNVIDGNNDGKLDTAAADFQSREVGNIDFTGNEEEIAAGIRNLISMLPSNNTEDAVDECNDDLNRVCEGIEGAAGDTSIMLAMIADDNDFVEVKKDCAKSMVTGFMRVNGMTVGAVANRSEICDETGKTTENFGAVISGNGAYKAAEFVEFCDAFNIPVVSFTNVKGFETTLSSERVTPRAAAKLAGAFANATVPKINVVIGEAYGSAYTIMNSKALGADMVYAWENASIGMMEAESAVKIMYADEISKADDAKEMISQKAQEYAQLQSNIWSAASRGYVDTVIEPADTRKYIAAALEMLFTKREDRPAKKHTAI